MRSRLRLQVILGIPVRVKNDDSVSRRKIDSETSSTSGQEETEILKFVNKNLLVLIISEVVDTRKKQKNYD